MKFVLIIALIMIAVSVVIFNIHIYLMRKRAREKSPIKNLQSNSVIGGEIIYIIEEESK